MQNVIKCYTDASFCPQTKWAVSGYCIPQLSQTISFLYPEANGAAEAEVFGLAFLLETVSDVNAEIVVHTDCESAVRKIEKRKDDGGHFTKMLQILDSNPNIKIKHVQGHKKRSLRSPSENDFSTLDKAVRKELRRVRKL